MSAPPRGTASQYSKGVSALGGAFSRLGSGIAGRPREVRWALAAVGLLGALLLIVSEFTTVTHVKVITVVLPHSERTGFDQNSGAMLILGLVALPMLYGAARAGSRPAMLAVGVLGLIAFLIAILGDLPDVTQAGLIFRERYEDAKAEPQLGFYLEVAGAVLLFLSAGLMFLSGVSKAPTGESGSSRQPTRPDA
jgi:hypothetical protein